MRKPIDSAPLVMKSVPMTRHQCQYVEQQSDAQTQQVGKSISDAAIVRQCIDFHEKWAKRVEAFVS